VETRVPELIRTAPRSKPIPVSAATAPPLSFPTVTEDLLPCGREFPVSCPQEAGTSGTPLDKVSSDEGSLDVDMRVQQLPEYVGPSFNIRDIKKKLLSPDFTFIQRFTLLLGLHYKMWHLSAIEMTRLLLQGGYGPDNAKLAWSVVDHCSIRKHWKRTKTKPTAAIGTSDYISTKDYRQTCLHSGTEHTPSM
jgi:hypothetical protein